MAREDAYRLAAGLGMIAGMRSVAAPWLFSDQAIRRGADLRGTPFALLAARPVRALLLAGMLFEMGVIDQLPGMHPRTDPLPLAGRVLSGATVGAAVCVQGRCPLLLGALIGAGTAFLSSHGFYRLRRAAFEHRHVPNLAAGLIEDAAVVALGLSITQG